MHNSFDLVAKGVGEEALAASGVTIVQYEIFRGARHADIRHDPDPARGPERARLGLLGRIAEVLCLIEVFAHAPGGAEIRGCVGKHFDHWDACVRKARALDRLRRQQGRPPEPVVEPFLWIVVATVSAPVLRKLKADVAPGWPAGVYFQGDDLYRIGVVVADQLPRDRSTLLVRIMAAGSVLPDAVADLAALPADALERTVAEQILVKLQHVLGSKPSRTPEEEEFIVRMYSSWEEARKLGRDEGRNEGRNEGELAASARAVLTALRVRGIAVSDADRERILAEKDPARLARWHERAILAASVAEVLDEPSRAA
ncbi:MAG: hypothetical protein IT372_04160 [Polyangiaceae bacterium]|nr:hypothetical protein [Polyangiaceae bacterium]